MYQFATRTTIGGIVEYLHRDVPADLAFQNERTRWGTWLVVSQELNPLDSVYFGWAHAFRSPGNPGQHNDSTLVTGNGATFGPNQNQADMKLVAEYLVDAIKFDRMAEDSTDVALKASFRKQAAEYRKLALKRAKLLGMSDLRNARLQTV